jgi:hypothetical protein
MRRAVSPATWYAAQKTFLLVTCDMFPTLVQENRIIHIVGLVYEGIVGCLFNYIFICETTSVVRVPVTDPEVQVRSPALPHFLRSSGSRTRSTQPREYN